MPLQHKGAYWMRPGDRLSPDQLKRIFDESALDFSAEICRQATLNDLAPEAIERLREMWVLK